MEWRQILTLHEEWSEARQASEKKLSYNEYRGLLDTVGSCAFDHIREPELEITEVW